MTPARRLMQVIVLATVLGLAADCAGPDRSPSPGAPTTTPAAPAETPSAAAPSAAAPSAAPSSAAPTLGPGASAGRWEGAGTILWPRWAPRAVQLGDGRVLLLGDEGGKYEPVPEWSRFVEMWDPATGTWRETHFLERARGQFAAVSLLDGRALVAGGMNEAFQSYSSAYTFDPATERWTKVGLMDAARANPAAAVLLDGRVLVAGGGYYTGKPSAEPAGAFSLAAWREPPDGSPAPSRLRLADADPGPTGYALATAELFDPATGTWSETGPMRFARAAPTAVTLADGRVLVAGSGWADRVADGARGSIEIYDPATERFSLTDDLPPVDPADLERLDLPNPQAGARISVSDVGTLVALAGGDALLVNSFWSGQDPASEDELEIIRTLRFDAATGHWAEIGIPQVTVAVSTPDGMIRTELGVHHPDGIVAPLGDGRVLVVGGPGPDGLGTREAELLDPDTGAWAPLPDMPGARVRAEAVTLADGSVLIVGGYSNGSDGYPRALGDAFRFIVGS